MDPAEWCHWIALVLHLNPRVPKAGNGLETVQEAEETLIGCPWSFLLSRYRDLNSDLEAVLTCSPDLEAVLACSPLHASPVFSLFSQPWVAK